MRPTTATPEPAAGYLVYRFPDGTGFTYGPTSSWELGAATWCWSVWRMDRGHHAHVSNRRHRTEQAARNDLARRLRFYREVIRPAALPLSPDELREPRGAPGSDGTVEYTL